MLEENIKRDAKKKEPAKVNRRTYLGAVAGSVFANATTVAAQETDLSEVNWLERNEEYTYNETSFRIQDVFVQDSVFYQSMPDTVQVRNGSGLQYMFVNLQFEKADSIRPPFSKFTLVADNKRYDCGNTVDNVPLFAIVDAYREKMGETYHTEPMTPPESAIRVPPRYKNPVFTIGFALPRSLSAEQFGFGIVPDDQVEAAWELEDEVVEKLQRSPQFETLSVDGPKSIAREKPFEISISVKNTGQRLGTYRAIVGHRKSDHKKKFTVPIPAGEDVTKTVKFKYPPNIGQDLNKRSSVYQVLQDNAQLAEREIQVVS
jgi:hypothetical protein